MYIWTLGGLNKVSLPPLRVATATTSSLWLDSHDRGYPTDGLVEGSNLSYSGRFSARHEVGIGKIKPFRFIQGHRSQEQRSVNDSDRIHRQQGSNGFADALTVDFVERFEDVDRLSNDEIGHEEAFFVSQECGGSSRHVGWVTNQVANDNVGVNE